MHTPSPDPLFKSFVMQRHELTDAQFNEKWQAACGWLSRFPVNMSDPKAHAALMLYANYLAARTPESRQCFHFCATDMLMALL